MYQRIIIFLEDKLRNIGNEKGKRIWRELGEKGRVWYWGERIILSFCVILKI